MRAFRSFLFHWLTTSFLAIAIVVGVIWWVGDLLAFGDWRPLGTTTAKIVVTVVLALVWLLLAGIWWWRRRRRNREMIDEIVEEEPDPTQVALTEEEREVQTKFAGAMRELSKMRFKSRFGGSRYLYELPWYIFIGPPGAGKTTALEKCGLDFPRRRSGERVAIQDTRNIEWIFTNEAVFIDTAGRYTTQDSNRAVDSGSWKKLLELIVRRRPREPVNGVIVAISIGELATADAATIERHAHAVRDRLNEICETMRARIPVYLMFTKVDLLVGFNEFFQTMKKADREQVWGMTYPLKRGQSARARTSGDLTRFGEDFDLLIERLGEMQFPLIQDDVQIENRAKIFGFASQFSSLKPVIERFLNETFKPDRWSDAILLRGFYFTSATQVGQPVDRLISTMSREFGLERRVVDALAGVRERTYFLTGLLRDVIFPEAGLGSASRSVRRATTVKRYAAIAVCLLVPTLFGIGWWTVERHMAAEAATFAGELTTYEQSVSPLDVEVVADGDLDQVNDPLNILKAEMERLSADDQDAPLFGLGIGAMNKLRSQSEQAYHQALEDLLRPRLLYRTSALLADYRDEPEPLYDALKAYLMVGGRGPIDPDWLEGYLYDEWTDRYPATQYGDLLEDLRGHLRVLMTLSAPSALEIDEGAISVARTEAAQITLAQRAYRILKRDPEIQGLPPWRLTAGGRLDAEKVFVRSSGQTLDAPIPGLFTYDGFWLGFLPSADAYVDAALDEKWVLTHEEGEAEPTRAEIASARAEIRQLYADEYFQQWWGLLDDLRVVPFVSAPDAADKLRTLSSPQSPYVRVLQEIDRNTHLAQTPSPDSPMWLTEAGKIAFNRLASRFQNLTRVAEAGAQDVRGQTVDEGKAISDRFVELRTYVGADSGTGPLGQTMAYMRELYNVVADIAEQRGARVLVLSEQRPAIALNRQIQDAPQPVAAMVKEMLDQADAATVDGAKARLNDVWRSTVLRGCQGLIQGKYPFGGGTPVALGDLAQVLGHNGLIDTFFNQQLQAMVDDQVSPWRWKGRVGTSLGIPPQRLTFFENARKLRDAFFPNGRPVAELDIEVSVEAWDDRATGLEFELGGQVVQFSAARAAGDERYRLRWPGNQPGAGAHVRVQVLGNSLDLLSGNQVGQEVTQGETGEWGLFRLIGRSQSRPVGAGADLRVRVVAGGTAPLLRLRFDSATNPFKLRDLLRSFKCPSGF